MGKIYLLILLSLLLGSCSSVKPINSKDYKQPGKMPDHVDLSIDANEEKPDVLPQEETVRVGDRGGDVFTGPSGSDEQNGQVLQRKLRIGLNLGPGILRTINYVSFLKALERQNLSPDIITGTGMGAIVAAMYASGMTPEVIEWKFFKYFKEKRNNKPYDPDWINEIDEAFLTKFQSMNLQDTKKKFFITLYDQLSKKTYYFDKGNIRELLLLSLRLPNNYTENKKSAKYFTPIEKEVFNARLLRQLGAEFTIAVDALGSKFDFLNASEYLIGVYGRATGRIQKEKKEFDYSVTLPLSNMSLDSTKNGPLFLQQTYEFMLKQAPIINKKIQAKKESIANAGTE